MSKQAPQYLTNYDYLSKTRIGRNKYHGLTLAKNWIRLKIKETNLTLGELAYIAGYKTSSQKKVFAQIVENVDTYSKIFHPIALSINKYIVIKKQIDEGHKLEHIKNG